MAEPVLTVVFEGPAEPLTCGPVADTGGRRHASVTRGSPRSAAGWAGPGGAAAWRSEGVGCRWSPLAAGSRAEPPPPFPLPRRTHGPCRAVSGVNWLTQILSDLIFTTIQSKPVSTELPFIECGDPDKYQRMKQIPSPRILATHLNYNCLCKSICKNKAKILVLFNPKDTAVSFFHFHNNVPSIPSYSCWDEYSEFMSGKVGWGSYFDHAVTWNKHTEDENTMIIICEDLKEVKQLLCVVGDWKNLFTEAQNQEMDAKFKVCLEGTKLGVKLKYGVYCKA
ncbi:LOW QUALITY PROTEIN: sulfotransferase 6B1 [Podargus strigoides]